MKTFPEKQKFLTPVLLLNTRDFIQETYRSDKTRLPLKTNRSVKAASAPVQTDAGRRTPAVRRAGGSGSRGWVGGGGEHMTSSGRKISEIKSASYILQANKLFITVRTIVP